jgi:hypothetical protein
MGQMSRDYHTPPHDPDPLIKRLAKLRCADNNKCLVLVFADKCLACQARILLAEGQ